MIRYIRLVINYLVLKVFMLISLLRLKFGKVNDEKLEIGSGPVKKAGWVTLDKSIYTDVCWDLKNKLPFPDNQFSFIYSSHVLEHFAFRDLKRLLLEIFRILKPGGVFSICVPNTSTYIDIYLGNKSPNGLVEYLPAKISECPMDILNYIFYMDGHHKIMFDHHSLIYHLNNAGFVCCKIREFDPSLDLLEREKSSCYAECKKPFGQIEN